MQISIGFSRPKNTFFPWFSWIIRAAEKTEYSHVYVRWFAPRAQADLVYQASGTRVNFMGSRYFQKKAEIVDEFPFEIAGETYNKLLHFCVTRAGADYGVKQVIGIALVRLAALAGIKMKNPFADGEASWVCNEMAGIVLRDYIGLHVDADLEATGPRKLHEIIVQNRQVKTSGDLNLKVS